MKKINLKYIHLFKKKVFLNKNYVSFLVHSYFKSEEVALFVSIKCLLIGKRFRKQLSFLSISFL